MKKFLLIAALSLGLTSAYAQDWTTQVYTKGGKGIHESYLTNEWYDNLFVGGGAGISTRFTTGQKSDIAKCYINPSINIYLMKWFTPRIGARFGYIGFNGREGLNSYHPWLINHTPFPYLPDNSTKYTDSSSEPGVLHYGSMQLHGDLMWNIVNTFWGYKRDRFYHLSLYAACGYLRLYDNKTQGNKGIGSSCYDQEFVLGGGLYNTFRITDRLMATADLRFSNHASRYRSATGVRTNSPSLTFGVAYNVYKTNWTDVAVVKATVDEAVEAAEAAQKQIKVAKLQNVQLSKTVEALQKELNTFKEDTSDIVRVDAVSYANLKARAEKAELVVYFYINKSILNFSELFHLETYVRETLAQDPNHVFRITGSADKGTGNETINTTLSLERALFVKNYIMKKFGVKESNIITSSVITDKHMDGALDRCALLEK